MNWRKATGTVASLILILASSAPLSAQTELVADKVVAVVGNSAVLYSEVEMMRQALLEEQKSSGYTSDRDPMGEALEKLIIQKVLYNQSQIDSIKIATDRIAEAVQKALDTEIARRGSVAALEMFYHKPIFNIREDLRTRYQEANYANEMENSIKSKVTITPGEVEKYYRQLPKDSLPVIPEQYVYAQILRYPASVENAKLRAQERLLELRERIIKGEKFETLARIYSEDPQSAIRGGDLGFMTKEMLVEPFANAMVQLKPDQVSGVVRTDFGYHLIQMVEKRGNEYHTRHILLKPQYTQKDLEVPYDLLDSLRKEIVAGKITFEAAVEKFSEDRYSKKNGGIVSNLEQLEFYYRGMVDPSDASVKFFKEYLSKEDNAELSKLKPGEMSLPYAAQDTHENLICKVIRLQQVIPTHKADLKDDYKHLERLALEQKQEKTFQAWLGTKIDGMYIRIDADFQHYQFVNPALRK
ncbi:MAG: peptidylprolyl isomerase [Alistipes sp.]|nr:peptidylprolyl isomerase [Alistipes sp.]